MPYLQLDDRQFPLRVGEARLGGADALVPVDGASADDAPLALVTVSEHTVSIRRATIVADVRVNGVRLGAEPSPLLHGDKIEIAGVELVFAADERAGNTQLVSSVRLAQVGAAADAVKAATAATGGRLVSLMDGREYVVAATPLTFGRDASSDIVVPAAEVSRRHAQVGPAAGGYVVRDQSTNGVWVNGERVVETRILARGDVVRVGTEEFRFHADAAVDVTPMDGALAPVPAVDAARADTVRVPPLPVSVPLPTVRMSPPEAGVAPPAAALPIAPAASAERLSPPSADVVMGDDAAVLVPATSPPLVAEPDALPAAAGLPAMPAAMASPARNAQLARAVRPTLAYLEVVSVGALQGRRFALETPLVHVGRGPHNDIVLADESISETHVKLQKRDAGWFVVDMASTNGTWVAGRRIQEEAALVGAPDLRLGGVKLTFHPGAPAGAAAAPVTATTARRPVAERVTGDDASASPRDTSGAAGFDDAPAASHRRRLGFLALAAALAAAGAYLFFQGR